MKAEIIASGTEILLGEIVDTNTSYIAGHLATLGIDLYYTSSVGDNYERFTGVLRQAWRRSDLIIITGGLGPTQGDITRNVIAGMLGEELTVDAALKSEITAYFAGRGLQMPENNLRQATLVPSAEPLRNAAGTAPGWWVQKDGRIIVTLPGPPGEMQEMWQQQVFPRLRKYSGAVILSRTLKCWGLSEARVDQLVSPFLSASNPTLALYARHDGINIRITAKADTDAAAQNLLCARENEIRQIIGNNIWGVDSQTMEGEVARRLRARKATIALDEDFTGGMVAYTLASLSESGDFFRGGIIVPASEAASAASAAAKARAVRAQFGATVAMAISGYCDSSGRIPGGRAFISVDMDPQPGSTEVNFPGKATQVIRRTINHAMAFLIEILNQRN